VRYELLVASALIVVLCVVPAAAKDWIIKADGSGDASSIQAGIDAASSVPGADRVVLADDTFTGSGNFDIRLNKPITLTSMNDAALSIIDFQMQRGIVIESMTGEPTISNITIMNASYSGDGGGISIDSEDPIITGCVITGCSAWSGAGIFSVDGNPVIQLNEIASNSTTGGAGAGIAVTGDNSALIDRNTIYNNSITGDGKGVGIHTSGGAPVITDNTVYGNTSATNNGGGIFVSYASGVYTVTGNVIHNNSAIYGGGLFIKSASNGVIANNTLTENHAQNWGPGLLVEGSIVTVSHSVIAFNTGGDAVFCFGNATVMLNCCLVWNPGADKPFSCQTQNLVQADPDFCGIANSRNYELQSDSPAAPANSPCQQQIGALGVNCGTTPTLLGDFTAEVRDFQAVIAWRLTDAGENLRFFVFREELTTGTSAELDAREITGQGFSFTLFDPGVQPGETYRYRVEADDEDGRRILFITRELAVPNLESRLHANQPNPFNPETLIRYDVGVAGQTRLEIFGASGRLVAVLFDGYRDAGQYDATWNGTNQAGDRVPSGVYFYRLRTAKTSVAKRMVLLK
jgi:hypothetical protein